MTEGVLAIDQVLVSHVACETLVWLLSRTGVLLRARETSSLAELKQRGK